VVLNTIIKNSKEGVACYAYNVSVYYTLTFTVDKPTRYNWNIVESGVNTITITLDKLCFVSFYRTWHHGQCYLLDFIFTSWTSRNTKENTERGWWSTEREGHGWNSLVCLVIKDIDVNELERLINITLMHKLK